MKNIVLKLALITCAVLSLNSCAYKRLAYLQDMMPGVNYPVTEKYETTIRKGDKLEIVVTANSPALAAPFNLTKGVSAFDATTGDVQYSMGEQEVSEYLVNQAGEITFPVLGDLCVEGMTPSELKLYIEDLIISKEYIREPVVKVNISNFKITVLGETGVGNFNIESNGINIFELIAMTGDLSTTAKRNDIWVIRNENGIRKIYSINPQSRSAFDSPVFYLQQNDMVYVKPRKSKTDSTMDRFNRTLSTFLASISSVGTILLWVYTMGWFGNN